MHIGFLEPHLRPYGGVRRVVEFGNRIAARGHDVSYLLPSGVPLECGWLQCAGAIRHREDACADHFDVLVLNHEPDWPDLLSFSRVGLRVYYVLHYAMLYDKPQSWESYRCGADLVLANSHWTAECVAAEIGDRPVVIHGGINSDHFRPANVVPECDVMAMGEKERAWKGTSDIEAACRELGCTFETYHGKGIPQDEMYLAYARARVFAQASWFEGFGQPGLEALACGVPLVTTDCGGCRDYAIHEKTALVVPPRDPKALAGAINRMLADRTLARELAENGRRMVLERFDWDRATDRLLDVLCRATGRTHAGVSMARPIYVAPAVLPHEDPRIHARLEGFTSVVRDQPNPPEPRPFTSIIVPVWDQLELTQAMVESVREKTASPYELIIVDNGSRDETRKWADEHADVFVGNPDNRGFAIALNQGLSVARGDVVVFIKNDTRVVSGWLDYLLATLTLEDAGLVAPVVTNAGGWISVRAQPTSCIREILPFSEPPPGVCFAMPKNVIEELGGWAEDYLISSGADLDLCYRVWMSGRRVYLDERVLIEHASKGTAREKLQDWQQLWQANRRMFFERWMAEPPLPEEPAGEVAPAEGLSSVVRYQLLLADVEKELERARMRSQRERRHFASILLHHRREIEALDCQLVEYREMSASTRFKKRLAQSLEGTELEKPARRVWERLKRVRQAMGRQR